MHNDSENTLPEACGPITPKMLANARQVVNDPARFHDRPILRRLAWVTLMGARGKKTDQVQLQRMAAERYL